MKTVGCKLRINEAISHLRLVELDEGTQVNYCLYKNSSGRFATFNFFTSIRGPIEYVATNVMIGLRANSLWLGSYNVFK